MAKILPTHTITLLHKSALRISERKHNIYTNIHKHRIGSRSRPVPAHKQTYFIHYLYTLTNRAHASRTGLHNARACVRFMHHADLLKLSKYHNYTCGTLSTRNSRRCGGDIWFTSARGGRLPSAHRFGACATRQYGWVVRRNRGRSESGPNSSILK